MDLTKLHANKITCINESKVVLLPMQEFVQGDMLMLFNNTDDCITLESDINETYISGNKQKQTIILWPARALLNIVFIQTNLVVVKVEI